MPKLNYMMQNNLDEVLATRYAVEAVQQMNPLPKILENVARMTADVESNLYELMSDAQAILRFNKRVTEDHKDVVDNPPFNLVSARSEIQQLARLREAIAAECDWKTSLKLEMTKLKKTDEAAYSLCEAVFLLDKYFPA